MQVNRKEMFIMQAQKEKNQNNTLSAAKAAAALRVQIQYELQNKKQCGYQSYPCTQLSLDGYKYCLRHILIDKNAPYRQCSYVYGSNGKRCYLPAPKCDKKELGYCSEHALKTHLVRAKQGSRQPLPKTAEVLLNSLSYYVKKTRPRNVSTSTDDGGRNTPDDGDNKTTKCMDPFTEIDAPVVNQSCSEILDMCSESESDVEPSTFSSVWQDAQADTSENESIDSDQEDVLKHANVYSAEEITLVTRDKLIRLQSLYIDQYHHLQHMLKERRRKYLHALKREKETCCSISNQAKDNPKEQRMYKKLKAYNQYHRKLGKDAILRKRLNEMRIKVTDGAQSKPQHYQNKCSFTEGGVKCSEKALPVARHCRRHILEDPNQVLFKACGKNRADIECFTPVEAIFDDQTCELHRDIPVVRVYSQPRKDSDSEYDETLDSLMTDSKVKSEYMDPQMPFDLMSNFMDKPSTSNDSDDMKYIKMEEMYNQHIEDEEETQINGIVNDLVDEFQDDFDSKESDLCIADEFIKDED